MHPLPLLVGTCTVTSYGTGPTGTVPLPTLGFYVMYLIFILEENIQIQILEGCMYRYLVNTVCETYSNLFPSALICIVIPYYLPI